MPDLSDLERLWMEDTTAPIRRSVRHECGHTAAAFLVAVRRNEALPVHEVKVQNNLPEVGVPSGQTEFEPGWLSSLSTVEHATVLLAGIYAESEDREPMDQSSWLDTVRDRPRGDADDDVKRLRKRVERDGENFDEVAVQAKLLLDSLARVFWAMVDQLSGVLERRTLEAAKLEYGILTIEEVDAMFNTIRASDSPHE